MTPRPGSRPLAEGPAGALSVSAKLGQHVAGGGDAGLGVGFAKRAGLPRFDRLRLDRHPGGVAENGRALGQDGLEPVGIRGAQDFVEVVRQAEPAGLDAVFEGMAGEYFKRGFSVLGKGGVLVGYGNPLSFSGMLKVLGQVALFNLLPNGKSAKYYSTGVSRLNWDLFLEDWAKLFELMETGQIKPIIAAKFPILEAAKANALLETGQVIGNIVLLAPELL